MFINMNNLHGGWYRDQRFLCVGIFLDYPPCLVVKQLIK